MYTFVKICFGKLDSTTNCNKRWGFCWFLVEQCIFAVNLEVERLSIISQKKIQFLFHFLNLLFLCEIFQKKMCFYLFSNYYYFFADTWNMQLTNILFFPFFSPIIFNVIVNILKITFLFSLLISKYRVITHINIFKTFIKVFFYSSQEFQIPSIHKCR